MKAIYISDFVKDYDEIRISEVPEPQPKKHEVLVQIIAAGVNFVDLLYCRGKHQNNRCLVRPPFILGLEFAGTVLSSPAGSKFSPGDRVFGGSLGSYAERISVQESSLHLIPQNWDFSSAAGLAATAPVSYGALVFRAGLKTGETVLVHAAAGGLGLMAVQIAKAVGATVIATAGSSAKLSVAKRFGADHCLNYTNPEWHIRALELTHNQGVDVVYDPVGLVDKSLKCLKQKGRILLIGFTGIDDPSKIEKIAMNRVLLRQAQVIGYRYGMTGRVDPKETEEIWKGLQILLERGSLKPTVFERAYKGLESVVPAMKDLNERKVWGKAVVLLNSDHAARL